MKIKFEFEGKNGKEVQIRDIDDAEIEKILLMHRQENEEAKKNSDAFNVVEEAVIALEQNMNELKKNMRELQEKINISQKKIDTEI